MELEYGNSFMCYFKFFNVRMVAYPFLGGNRGVG